MVISKITGGLGNQLFQYAAGKALAVHHNTNLKLDISHFNDGGLRKFELNNFFTEVEIADPDEVEYYVDKSILYKVYKRIFLPPYDRKPFKEPSFNFYKNFFKAPVNCYLKGNWQSEKYFLSIQDTIRREFNILPQYVADLQSKANEMQQENSVSIHIRRGDYLNAEIHKFHGTVPIQFYKSALKAISKKVSHLKIYFFSDDIEWVRENLKIDFPHEYISHHVTKNHLEDFFLMQHCKHNILANSSFSWWCAWLNNYNNKIVIATKKWFNEADHNTTDLIPSNWQRL